MSTLRLFLRHSMEKRTFTVRELADLAGVSPSALRAWERRFAIFSPERTQGGHRLYTLDDLKVLWYVRRQQNLGKDLRDIAAPGREALLAEAFHYFDVQSENPTPQELSQGESLMECLRKGNLALMAEILETLSLVSTGPAAFAEHCLSLTPLLRQAEAQGQITPLAHRSTLAHIRAIMLRLCLASPAITSPLALVASLSQAHDGLGSLWLGLLLRQWGYRVVLLGEGLTLEEVHEHVVEHAPRVLALGIPAGALAPQAGDLATLVAPYAVTLVTPDTLGGLEAPPASRFYQVVTSDTLATSEALARRRLQDERAPVQLMQELTKSSTRAQDDSAL